MFVNKHLYISGAYISKNKRRLCETLDMLLEITVDFHICISARLILEAKLEDDPLVMYQIGVGHSGSKIHDKRILLRI